MNLLEDELCIEHANKGAWIELLYNLTLSYLDIYASCAYYQPKTDRKYTKMLETHEHGQGSAISYFMRTIYRLCVYALLAAKLFLSYSDIVGAEVQVIGITHHNYASIDCAHAHIRIAVRQSRRARVSAARTEKN